MKNLPANAESRRLKRPGFAPWVGKIPWSRKWQSTPVFLLGEFHRQRSLTGYSPGVTKSQALLKHVSMPV